MVGINSGILSTEVAPLEELKSQVLVEKELLKVLMNIWKLNIYVLVISVRE